MRFCMVTTFYPPYSFGGDGVFVRRLSRALVRRGHQVRVVFQPAAHEALGGARHPDDACELGAEAGIEPWPLPSPAGRAGLLLSHQAGAPALQSGPLREALGGGFDVVHFHNVSLLGGPAVLAMADAPVTLCTLHDYWFVCPMHVLWRLGRERCTRRTCLRCTLAGGRPPQLWRATGAVRRAARAVDAFLAPSAFAARLHAENGFPAPVRVLPHFPDPAAGRPPGRPEDPGGPSVQTPEGRPYFLAVGRLEPLKGFADLVERFRSIPDADLLVVGAGNEEADLRRRAAHLPNVRVLGWREGEPLAALYRGAVAAVVPSLCYETFGLVPVEAFAAGTPAVVRAGGALEEVVAGGGGLPYETEEELEAILRGLLDEPGRRRALAHAARRNLERNYTEEIHMDRYFDLIGGIRGRRPARRAAG